MNNSFNAPNKQTIRRNNLCGISRQAYVPITTNDKPASLECNFRQVTNTPASSLMDALSENALHEYAATLKTGMMDQPPAKEANRFNAASIQHVMHLTDMVDDFYLNPIAVGNGFMAVSGRHEICLASTVSQAQKRIVFSLNPRWKYHCVTSIAVCPGATVDSLDCPMPIEMAQSTPCTRNNVVFFGTSGSAIGIVNLETGAVVAQRILTGVGRIATLALHPTEDIIAVGTKSGTVVLLHLNFQTESIFADVIAAELCGHIQEVCGLKWNSNGEYLASGSNDNCVFLWQPDLSTDIPYIDSPVMALRGHRAAVKAISWHPTMPNLIATGAGSNDGHIRIFDAYSGDCICQTSTTSQICGVEWCSADQLAVAYGFSANGVSLWKWSQIRRTLTESAVIMSHARRMLFLGINSERDTIVASTADGHVHKWQFVPKQRLCGRDRMLFMPDDDQLDISLIGSHQARYSTSVDLASSSEFSGFDLDFNLYLKSSDGCPLTKINGGCRKAAAVPTERLMRLSSVDAA